MEEEREEGEIVDVVDDDIYENIISSDEEVDLRSRIEELEAKNLELEKIASISKTNDYDLACGNQHFIDLVGDDDDDESYYRLPSKYDYSGYTSQKSRSRRKKACRHVCKRYKRHKQLSRKAVRRKKLQLNKTNSCSGSSSDDEFQLDRNELTAAVKRSSSPINSSTLKRKLIGVTKTVEDFIKAKDDVVEDDISTSIEIMHLLSTLNIENIAPENAPSSDNDNEVRLSEQELRLIALKSAIVKKHEARKKRRVIETQPYSPTDTDIVMENVIPSKEIVTTRKDEWDNMEISPAVSPSIQDGCLQPIDMELESEDENQITPVLNTHQITLSSPISIEKPNAFSKVSKAHNIVPLSHEQISSTPNVPEETNRINLSVECSIQQQEEEEEEQALRAALLANLRTSKKRVSLNKSSLPEKLPEKPLPLNKPIIDVSMEAEHLRTILLSSVQKRRNLSRQLLPNPFAALHQKIPAQVSKRLEMSMPQITSNLKEALKRIKQRGKPHLDPDLPLTDQVVTIDDEKIICDTASDSNHSKQTYCIAALKEKSEVESKIVNSVDARIAPLSNHHPVINEDQRLVMLDNSEHSVKVEERRNLNDMKSINTKNMLNVSDVAKIKPIDIKIKANLALKNVKCIVSPSECKTKDIPLVISNKNETALLDKNDLASRSVHKTLIAENKISNLNQKENLHLSEPKRNDDDKVVIVTKKAKLNATKSSKVITTPVEKPVKQMIIQLNNSDSESDEQQNAMNSNGKSSSDCVIPASYTFSTASSTVTSDKESINNKTSNSVETDSFQQKLDEYLKSARIKVDQAKVMKRPVQKTSSVRHLHLLPPSSQLEYHNLLKRMALLEKRRSQKMEKIKNAGDKSTSNENISVTITNELCHRQSKKDAQLTTIITNDITFSKKITSEVLQVQNNNLEMSQANSKEQEINSNILSVHLDTNKQNVLESCCLTGLTHNTPDTSSCSSQPTQNLATLTEDDKKKLLHNAELEYMMHSSSYLTDLNKMSLLVCEARQEKKKQFELEVELETLKLKIQQVDHELAKQKIRVSKLYPIISASHKNIMKKRSQSLQLNKKCYQIGNKIEGADYKIPDDSKSTIADKIKSLSAETKLLKNMEKPSSKVGDLPRIIDTAKPSLSCDVDHNPLAHDTTVTKKNLPNFEKQADIEQKLISKKMLPDIPKEFSKISVYQSPLDHMKNIDIVNPDLIVCPFQLLGECEDKECTYQHLS